VGLVADAAGRAVVIVDMRWVILGIEAVPAWIVHKLAVVVGAEVTGLAWVVVVVAVAAVVGDADIVAVVVRWLAFGVVAGVVVVVVGNLCWFGLRCWGHIVDYYS